MAERIDFHSYISKEHENPAKKAEYDAWQLPIALAKRLQEERRKQKLTQKKLAEKLGVPQQDISKVENLTGGVPKLATLQRIAGALGLRLEFSLVPKNSKVRSQEATDEMAMSYAGILTRFKEVEKKLETVLLSSSVRSRPVLPPVGQLGQRPSSGLYSTVIGISQDRPAANYTELTVGELER